MDEFDKLNSIEFLEQFTNIKQRLPLLKKFNLKMVNYDQDVGFIYYLSHIYAIDYCKNAGQIFLIKNCPRFKIVISQ